MPKVQSSTSKCLQKILVISRLQLQDPANYTYIHNNVFAFMKLATQERVSKNLHLSMTCCGTR